MVIRANDRVARVLEGDEGLVDVFAAASPHFERLRNPALRRVMARLVTVEQAARIAGVPVESLLARLNAGTAVPPADASAPGDPGDAPVPADGGLPSALAAIPRERITDLDVRDALRRGEEPFSRIMAARQALPEGHVLRLRALFEPVPLYAVMARHGFLHWTEQLGPDDWRVWFHPAGQAPPREREAPPPAPAAGADGDAEDTAGASGVVMLDVRGLEPPEPMVRTLAALEALPPGATLVQINVRTPRFLLPRLEALGFAYEVREQGDGLVRVLIRRRDGR